MQSHSDLILVLRSVIAILAVFSAAHALRLWLNPSPNLHKIGSRIRFLWGMTIVFLLAVCYSDKILLLYLWLLAFLALKEFLSITPTRRVDRRVLFFAYLSIPIQFILIWLDWYQVFIIFIPVHIFLILPIIMVLAGETDGFLRAWSTLGWGILTTVFTLGFLAYLALLPPLEGVGSNTTGRTTGDGLSLFLFLVGLAQINYAVQYYFGKRVDDPKLSLKVSQTRNWASLIGSMIITAPLAWILAPLLTPFGPWEAIGIGTIISAGAFVGYVILSAIKADLQLADRGTMEPGRGGVLNRIDTFVYAAPVFFYIVSRFHYQEMF